MSFNKDALLHKTQDELDKYRKGFNVLMQYWDSLPDESKPKIDKELAKIGL